MKKEMKLLNFVVFTAIVALYGCGNPSNGGAEDVEQSLTDSLLPLPEVPAELTLPAERAAYVIGHFWDEMDFSDTLLSRNVEFVERNFAEYASLFPHAQPDTIDCLVGGLLNRCAVDMGAYLTMAGVAEKYLFEAGSPMRNYDYYRPFLEALAAHGSPLDSLRHERYAHQLEMIRRNARGELASDFAAVRSDGRRGTFRQLLPGTPLRLVMFYDPECDDCVDAIDVIQASAVIGEAVGRGRLGIAAVCATCVAGASGAAAGKIPAGWTEMRAADEPLADMELYLLPSFPTLYLLDGSGRVVLKDVDPLEVSDYLNGV